MEKLRVMVVDHSVINRKNMTDLVNETQFGEVVKSASNGQIALEWLQQCQFDVILMDVFVVREIGITGFASLKRNYPRLEVILMSDRDEESAKWTLESMNVGALDFIMRSNESHMGKTAMNIKSELEAIFTQIKVKQYFPLGKASEQPPEKMAVQAIRREFVGKIDLVLIASSTGGPVALETICQQMPGDFPVPILIVQHMPPEFTHVLASSFDKKYKPTIYEGKNGDLIQPGHMVIAPGGYHMVLVEGAGNTTALKLLDTPFVNGVKPAADVLFQSVAEVYKNRNILVVVLTGMGNDGTKGIEMLKSACNCYCLTQSEKTCIVYGMPKCVYEAGLSDEVVDLKDMALRINRFVKSNGGV